MRSTAFSKTEEEKEFESPCLIQHKDNNMVILVLGSYKYRDRQWINGIVVFSGTTSIAVGSVTDCWDSDQFNMYRGEVRLSN